MDGELLWTALTGHCELEPPRECYLRSWPSSRCPWCLLLRPDELYVGWEALKKQLFHDGGFKFAVTQQLLHSAKELGGFSVP